MQHQINVLVNSEHPNQTMHRSDCIDDAQADLGLYCRIMPNGTFTHDMAPTNIFQLSKSIIQHPIKSSDN